MAAVMSSVHIIGMMRIFQNLYFTGLLLLITSNLSQSQEDLYDLYNSGKFESVIYHSSKAIASGDTAFNTLYLKILSEIQIGQAQEAIHTLERAALFFPEDDRIK